MGRKELTLTLLDCVSGTAVCPDIDIVRFMSERIYRRSGDDPSY